MATSRHKLVKNSRFKS